MKRVRAFLASEGMLGFSVIVFAVAVLAAVLWVVEGGRRDRIERLERPATATRQESVIRNLDACSRSAECRVAFRRLVRDVLARDRRATPRAGRDASPLQAAGPVAQDRRDATSRPPPRRPATRRPDRRDGSPPPGSRGDGKPEPSPGPNDPGRPPSPRPPDPSPVDVGLPLPVQLCTALVRVNC